VVGPRGAVRVEPSTDIDPYALRVWNAAKTKVPYNPKRGNELRVGNKSRILCSPSGIRRI